MVFEQKPFLVDKKQNQDVDSLISKLLISSYSYRIWLLWKLNLYEEEDNTINWTEILTV